jgi:hypothetical protein
MAQPFLMLKPFSSIKQQKPNMQVVQQKTLTSGGHKPFQIFSYSPTSDSNYTWEQVAYGEDDEYYITFVVSSRSKLDLNKALPAFASMIASYK